MNQKKLWLAASAAAWVAGCAAPTPIATPAAAPALVAAPVAPPVPAPAPCNAEGAKFAMGQMAAPQLEAAARVRADALVSRVLKPGQAVTMEFNASRLNLVVDARNRVTAVRCG